ncbi:MBL fold metallo-hydrolase [Abyssisolibacter fermentans]|uniref:MBL fold metallo-hydrolase n=1 Tax=Abyssisolibacter fermentans TaxID=1766203 RepID=UPI00082B8278|nr:MBL fold metallo-hydrolase [Abyssisolibacter fermentans]
MKLSVLVDNNAMNIMYAEWGLSYYIEESDKKILFDLGSSNLFIENAEKMKINLEDLDYVVISHGHWDHVWGLQYLIRYYRDKSIPKSKRPTIIAHPLAFIPKYAEDKESFEHGSIIYKDEVMKNFNTIFTDEPYYITENLVFLGEITRKFGYENKEPLGKIYIDNQCKDDYIYDDTALAYINEEILTIITGCSHSGICNICEHAKAVTSKEKIQDIIGGFHLIDPEKEQMEKTLEYIRSLNTTCIHPCHCTSLNSKIELSKVSKIENVATGIVLKYK